MADADYVMLTATVSDYESESCHGSDEHGAASSQRTSNSSTLSGSPFQDHLRKKVDCNLICYKLSTEAEDQGFMLFSSFVVSMNKKLNPQSINSATLE